MGKFETLNAPPAPTLLTVYFEQREAMRRFFQARLGAGADVEDLLQDLYLKASAAERLGPAPQLRRPGRRLA